NLDRAMLLISNRLSGVDDLPDEASEPRLLLRGSEDIPIAYFAMRRAKGNTSDLEIYGDLIEDVIVDRIERVPGVAGVDSRGGSRRELRIVVDPEKMAQYRLTVPDVCAPCVKPAHPFLPVKSKKANGAIWFVPKVK
ncbi:MAG: efflux RND transporter permease subunit, partial [Rhodospirillales bacterium]|nr:efflux RND transporter permease subunit [Rhodospirillales bacterium]